MGCPPELVPDGGHPIPLICRGRKRFVRGNIKRMKKGTKQSRFEIFGQVYGFLLAVGLELVWEIIGNQII